MLNITPLRNTGADGGGGGVPAYLKATEYYLDKNGIEQSSSAWYGKGPNKRFYDK